MNIRDFVLNHREFCNRYNIALELFYRCSCYIEEPIRTDIEIEKYSNFLMTYSKNLSLLRLEYKRITGDELDDRQTLGGFILYDKVS